MFRRLDRSKITLTKLDRSKFVLRNYVILDRFEKCFLLH